MQSQVTDLQNSFDQQQKEMMKLKERHDEDRAEWRAKHEEQIVSIEVWGSVISLRFFFFSVFA